MCYMLEKFRILLVGIMSRQSPLTAAKNDDRLSANEPKAAACLHTVSRKPITRSASSVTEV
jgi:hypothetical protein